MPKVNNGTTLCCSKGELKSFTHNLKPPNALSVFVQVADTVLLSIVNSLAVIYIYNQFASLRKAGSKYLLGKLMVDKSLDSSSDSNPLSPLSHLILSLSSPLPLPFFPLPPPIS